MTNVGESGLMQTNGIGPLVLQQCLNEEQKSSVTHMGPTIPRKSDDGNVSCPAWSVNLNTRAAPSVSVAVTYMGRSLAAGIWRSC